MSEKRRTEWIKFVEVNLRDGRKTLVWAVLTIDGRECLGRVGWYSPWRKYCFIPSEKTQTIFEEDCLRRIAEFIEGQSALHRQIGKEQKLAAHGR